MTRLFAILLILILPLQLISAGAAGYCANEADNSTQHYGHHEHDGAKNTSASVIDDKKSLPVSDSESDCDACHLCSANLQACSSSIVMPEVSLPSNVSPLLLAAQHQPSPLQRPPIASLA